MKKPAKKTHYTITEAAKKLKISRQAVHLAISNKQLKAEQRDVVQKVWFIPADALKEYTVDRSQKRRGKQSA
jgi:predicted DNA-binding protein YlxM (UPF0122 family)